MKKPALGLSAAFSLLALSFLVAVGLHCNPRGDVTGHYVAELLIRGTVVDEDSVPLDRVAMTIETTVMNPGIKSKVKRRTNTIDRTFEIYRRSCTSIEVYFCKKGYYCDRMRFNTVANDNVGAVDLVRSDVVATLYRIVPQVDFMSTRGSLSFGRDGVREVLGLPGNVVGKLPIEMAAKYSSGDTPFVYIMAPKDDNKEIFQHQPGSKRSEYWYKPRGVKIVFTNPEDGAVPFLFGEGTSLDDQVFRRMREAPLSGYKRIVEYEELGNSAIYFYCSVNGLYGRGFVGLPILSSSKSDPQIGVHIEIHLNGNGSRDFTRIK